MVFNRAKLFLDITFNDAIKINIFLVDILLALLIIATNFGSFCNKFLLIFISPLYSLSRFCVTILVFSFSAVSLILKRV